MTIECPKCQTKNPDESKFCMECATPLPQKEDVVPTKTIETSKVELTTGSIFAGRYKIIEELGKGGMGRVYKVLDNETKEKIALKLIKPEIASDKKTIERFRNELTTARKIVQKNVCRMFDLNRERDSYYITMEFVSGGDLKKLIRRTKHLPVGTAISIVKQICEGLEEAHSLGIVHRDLKPNNIMIDDNGNARIMDFGIARTVKEKGITGSEVMIGTPEYMSPEQVEAKEVDQRSDLYSLGIIMYEMLTGSLPFEADSAFTIGVKHKSEKPKDPREINPQIPEDLSHVILKCLEKERGNRYQSAGELSTALTAIEQGIPTTERTAPPKKTATSKEVTVTFNIRKILFPAALAVLLAAAALVFLFVFPQKLDPDRFVVASFENRTGNPSLDQLGTIAADVLTTGLSQMEDIEVVPTMTTLPLSISQGPVGLKTLARETGARIVISGFFSLEAQNIRFRARFTDAKKEQVLRALDPVDGKTEEAALKALRQRVMGALGSIRGLSILEDTAARHIPTYEAYQEFITGYEEFGLDYANAFAHFEKALDLDPEFMNPRLAMGIGYTNQGQYEQAAFHLDKINEKRETHTPWERDYLDWALANLEGNQAQQMHFLRRLERQSPHDSIVNYLIGLVAIEQNRPQVTIETYKKFNLPEQRQNFVSSSWWFGNWARAYHMLGQYKKELKIARRAQELFPDFLTLKSYEVRALAAMGKMGEIERIIEESKTITPRYGSLTGLLYDAAVELRARGYLEESQDYAHKTNEIYRSQLSETESETIRFYLARALIYAGQLEESKALFDSLILANPPDIQYKRILGILEAMMGHREAALQIYRELEGFTGPYLHGEHIYGMACISAWLGEKDQAIELLKKSFANGWGYGDYLLWDISLEPLRECNSFQELIKPKR